MRIDAGVTGVGEAGLAYGTGVTAASTAAKSTVMPASRRRFMLVFVRAGGERRLCILYAATPDSTLRMASGWRAMVPEEGLEPPRV
jgi:hypothetical protein